MPFVTTSKLILRWEDPKTRLGTSIRFDVVSSETHEALVAITDTPVEEGPNVVDHARDEPETLAIEAFVSNNPLLSNPEAERYVDFQQQTLTYPKKNTRGGIGGALATVANGASIGLNALNDLISGGQPKAMLALASIADLPPRARAMHDTIKDAKTKHVRIHVVSPVQELDDMMIQRLSVRRTPEKAGGFVFQLELRKVRIVTALTVDAPVPVEARGALAVPKGSQATAKDAKKEAKLKSLAAGGFDLLSGALGKLGF